MANEKKAQASTSKQKTTQAKTKQRKAENRNSIETNSKTTKVEKETQTAKKATMPKKSSNKNKTNQNEAVKKNLNHVSKKTNNNGKREETKTSQVVVESSNNQKNPKKSGKKEKQNYKVQTKNEKIMSSSIVDSDEIGKFAKIIVVLVVIVVAFYGLTVLITKFQKTSVPERNKMTIPAVIQYDEILIGTMLNQARDEYYVLIQKDDDESQTLISYYLQNYNGTSNALKVYTSNMNSVFNQFYISEIPNVKTNNISEFRISAITLVKVKNHEIVEAYTGLEEVENAFKNMISQK